MKPPIAATFAYPIGTSIAMAIWPDNIMNIALVGAGALGGVWILWFMEK